METYTKEQKIKAMKELRRLHPYNYYGINKDGDLICNYESGAAGIVPNYVIGLFN